MSLTPNKHIIDIIINKVDIMINFALYNILKDFARYDYQPLNVYKLKNKQKM